MLHKTNANNANVSTTAMTSVNAQGSRTKSDRNAVEIMKDIHTLYTDVNDGISMLAQSVGLVIHPPRRKVNVLVIGNHSAGKSSFINWYVGDEIQRTGMAIETQGFTIVTSGMKKTLAPIKGDSTVMLYPYLQLLKQKFGKPLVDNLQTCVSDSMQREFAMVDFIDSPGLVDGNIAYPFDVNDAIVEFADHCDLIFVFLDPMGQALCSRTMSVVKELNTKHFDKLKYYLTKADTVTSTKELMKLMVQITQNIKDNINNQHGLEIPTIWLPDHAAMNINHENDVNQLHDVCAAIETAIHQKVQDNLSQVGTDCEAVLTRTRELLAKDERECAARRAREIVAGFLSVCAWMIPLVTFITLVAEYQDHLPQVVLDARYVMEQVNALYRGLQSLLFPGESKPDFGTLMRFIGLSIVVFVVLNSLSTFIYSCATRITPQKREIVAKWRAHEQIIQRILQRRQGE